MADTAIPTAPALLNARTTTSAGERAGAALPAKAQRASVRIAQGVEGEALEAATRLVVAPDAGVFEPTIDLGVGSRVRRGQVVGRLRTAGSAVDVVSPFTGRTGASLAWPGERLTAHQPVMWLSIDETP